MLPKKHLQLKNSRRRCTTSRNAIATRSSPSSCSISCHSLKAYPPRKSLHSSAFEPSSKIFALTDVKGSEFVTAFYNRFDADARDSHAPSNGQLLKLQQVKTYASKRRVRYSTPTKGQIQRPKLGTSKRQHFGRRI